MTTAASFTSRTTKELADIAKKKGVRGWHAMRKDQLVQALVRLEKKQKSSARRSSAGAAKRSKKGAAAKKSAKPPVAKSSARTKPAGKAARNTSAKKSTSAKSGARSRPPVAKKASRPQRKSASPRASGKASVAKSSAKGNAKAKSRSGKRAKTKNPVALRKIQEGAARREKLKNLAFASEAARRLESVEKKGQSRRNGQAKVNGVHKNGPTKDRIVLLVRDSYWLQACWDITRQSVLRAQASMAEHWHSARPVLRLIEMEVGGSTSSAERVVRDTEIHGGVNNWYIDVHKPPQAFRVDIGYLAVDGRFHVLARSNTVTTPEPGGADAVDRNWADVAENYEKFYAMSGGYTNDKGDLQDVFEERLHRPMGASTGARFGAGAERMLHRDRNFQFDVDAEIIVFGTTRPDAHLTISGEPVKVRPDGTFAVRLALPDRRQVLPVTASSRDGVEERTIVLAIERNTKVMEAVMHDPNEQ